MSLKNIFSQKPRVNLISAAHHNPVLVGKMVDSAMTSYPGITITLLAHGGGFARALKIALGLEGDTTTGPVRVLECPRACGSAEALNTARSRAGDEFSHYLVTSPNVVFFEDAITRMLGALDKSKAAGAVGPITNHCWSDYGQVQQDPSFRVMESREVKYFNRAGEQQTGTITRVNEVPFINGFCFLLSRRVADEVGPFDVGFPPLCGYDDDFLMRIRIAGYKLYLDFGAFVFNLGLEVDKTRGLDLNRMKEAAAERIIDKYQIKGREVLYSSLVLNDRDRRHLLLLLEKNGALLRDMSGYAAYKLPELPEVEIEKEQI